VALPAQQLLLLALMDPATGAFDIFLQRTNPGDVRLDEGFPAIGLVGGAGHIGQVHPDALFLLDQLPLLGLRRSGEQTQGQPQQQAGTDRHAHELFSIFLVVMREPPQAVDCSSQPSKRMACSVVSPQNASSAWNAAQTLGRSGFPNSAHRPVSLRWMHRSPARLPWGMPGMIELMEGAMQHAPQPARHFMRGTTRQRTAGAAILLPRAPLVTARAVSDRCGLGRFAGPTPAPHTPPSLAEDLCDIGWLLTWKPPRMRAAGPFRRWRSSRSAPVSPPATVARWRTSSAMCVRCDGPA